MSEVVLYPCRCCGDETLSESGGESFEICSKCGWQDDPVQNADPEYSGGSNVNSLREAKEVL